MQGLAVLSIFSLAIGIPGIAYRWLRQIMSKLKPRNWLCYSLLPLVAACGAQQIKEPPRGHLGLEPEASAASATATTANSPPPITQIPSLPPPSTAPSLETYTVIVNAVPVKELLFALARDAQLNLDVYDDIQGNITINAIDQTLPQILERIARQTNIRYQVRDNNLIIAADTPFLKTYKVAYVNMQRDSVGNIALSTQIAASGTADVSGNSSNNNAGSNNSTLSVVNNSNNHFWPSLFVNIAAIIGETQISNSTALVSKNVVINKETGLISVRATSKQHAEVQTLLDNIIDSAKRQVLIEATIVEVELSNTYQTGVDWSRIAADPEDGFSIAQQLLGGNLANPPSTILQYTDKENNFNLSASVRLLEQFGDVKVLSSPKIMALNNQTSVLKVVDNRVYFTVDVDISQNQTNTLQTFETEIHTVPVGLVMALVPFVSENGEIILNIRPTISRILRFVNDPNPALADAGVVSAIPEIQVREMESMLRLNDSQIAVIGGLMQDSISKATDAVPGVSRIPGVGEAFKYRDDEVRKTELVVFLRTTVIKEPSVDDDLKQFKAFLPAQSNS